MILTYVIKVLSDLDNKRFWSLLVIH